MKYLILIYDSAEMTPEEEEKEFPEWMDYTRRLEEAGVMLGGEALQPTSTATTVRGKKGATYELTDGPFAETKEALGGFYMIDVPDLDQATEWAAQLPHIKRGGLAEVRPIMEFDG